MMAADIVDAVAFVPVAVAVAVAAAVADIEPSAAAVAVAVAGKQQSLVADIEHNSRCKYM
jgi:3-deoxy-D-manno-octulosonate 8-phosphate phosphatase KdsC-like HAD superfamily phosphatase